MCGFTLVVVAVACTPRAVTTVTNGVRYRIALFVFAQGIAIVLALIGFTNLVLTAAPAVASALVPALVATNLAPGRTANAFTT